MPELKPGDAAPDFTLPGTAGQVHLADVLKTGPVIVSFYQEDNTPTCSTQLASFRDDYDVVRELGAGLLAISTDSVEAHRRFQASLSPPFPLLADSDGTVARAYGVYDEVSRRARRAVVVIGSDGVIQLALPWYNPSNTAQYEQVFAALGAGA
jgi:peroxiredoxin Q/BCP